MNIYDIYAAVKAETGNENLSFTDFVKEYLTYTSSDLESQVTLQTSINRSLMASVSILAGFKESMTSSKLSTYSGSGVIIDVDTATGDMIVMTNCHVVYSTKASKISGQDGYTDNVYVWTYGSEYSDSGRLKASVIAASKTYDVALLKVTGGETGKKCKTATWIGGEETYLGETVYAIGNAGGDKMSANVGYISKDLQTVTVNMGTETYKEEFSYQVLRTSAPINSGNSGGGLFNAGGELVGLINSKSLEKDDSGNVLTGVGFALTASSTKRVVRRMLDEYDGYETHGFKQVNHHIVLNEEDNGYCTGLNEQGYAEIREDAVVISAFSGKYSGKIKSGDKITNVKITRSVGGVEKVVEDVEIKRIHNFNDVMLSVVPNDKVVISVMHGNTTEDVEVTFTENDFTKKQ
ncbi:MAG: serine protease [Clostridia bacterium]|nr:serine protease [Clostridia bacterium]